MAVSQYKREFSDVMNAEDVKLGGKSELIIDLHSNYNTSSDLIASWCCWVLTKSYMVCGSCASEQFKVATIT